jgi:hypothetical protein
VSKLTIATSAAMPRNDSCFFGFIPRPFTRLELQSSAFAIGMDGLSTGTRQNSTAKHGEREMIGKVIAIEVAWFAVRIESRSMRLEKPEALTEKSGVHPPWAHWSAPLLLLH